MKIEVNNYTINIHKEVFSILNLYTQSNDKAPEAGGIILGSIIDNEVNVSKLSVPTELDKATRTYFERHRLSAQIIINYEFYNSNKKLIYLGEWHTHPEKTPTPSSIDKDMIRNQFYHNKLNIDFLLLLIKGLESLYIAVFDENGLHNIQVKIT